MDKEGQRALETLQELAEAGSRLAAGDIVGGILGAVGTIGSLFGKSEVQREAERIQQQNTDALQALRDEITGLTTSIQSLAGAQEAIATLRPIDIQAARGLQAAGLGPQVGIDFLNEKLRETGFTLEELDRIAEGMGLDIVGEKGLIAADALETLEIVLGITIDDLTKFGDSLSGQRQILETRDKLSTGGMRQRASNRHPGGTPRCNASALAGKRSSFQHSHFCSLEPGHEGRHRCMSCRAEFPR